MLMAIDPAKVACVRRNTHYMYVWSKLSDKSNNELRLTISSLWHQKHVQKEHLNAPKKGGKTQS